MTVFAFPSRRAALGIILAGAVFGAAGCASAAPDPGASSAGGASASDPSASEGASLLPAAEGATSYPLTLETAWGSTTLEQRPERIAAVTPSQDDVEILAAMGVTPVLVRDGDLEAWARDAFAGPIEYTYSGNDNPFPAEEILDADPDLIIALNSDLSDSFDALAAIAPVVGAADAAASQQGSAMDWKGAVTQVAEALDLAEAGEKALAAEQQAYTDLKAEYPALEGKTATYLVDYAERGGLQYHSSPGSPASLTFEQMGLAPNPLAEKFEYRQEVSEEMLSDVDADVLIYSANAGNPEAVTGKPLFQAIPAVADERWLLIENAPGATSFTINGEEQEGNIAWALARGGPLSGPWAANALAPALAALVEE